MIVTATLLVEDRLLSHFFAKMEIHSLKGQDNQTRPIDSESVCVLCV